MNRFSRLPQPVRTSQLTEPGSSRETRISRNENRRTRASSSSRASNSVPLSTPSMRRSKSSLSLKRTPQSVQGSRTRSVDRQRIKKKDERPIQDKKWQAEMLCKTQEYFQNDSEGISILNQGRNLRPITNNMFVQLVNIVLKNIDEKFEELTTTNYVELMPKVLTRLMYPANVTPSMMKTANTMHNWPHILAILSWLVELHYRIESCKANIGENMYVLPNNMSEEELQELKILQLQSKSQMAAFVKWNKGEDVDDVFLQFSEDLKKINNLDHKSVQQLKQSLEKFTFQKECDDRAIAAQNEAIEDEEKEHAKLLENSRYAEDIVTQQKEYLRKLESKIAIQQESNQKLREADDKLLKEQIELENQVKRQPMTVQERDNLLRVIEGLKAKKDSIRKIRENTQQISDETDIRMSQMKQEMEEKVSAFNIALFKPGLKHPEIKDFAIEIDSCRRSDVFQLLLDKNKNAEKYHTELEKRLNDERSDLITIGKEFVQQQNKVEKQISENSSVQIKIADVKHKMLQSTEDKEKEAQHLVENISTLKDKISNIRQRFPNKDDIMEEIRKEAKEHEILKAKLKNSASAVLEIFENLEQEVATSIIPEYQDIRRTISESMQNQQKEVQEKLQEKVQKKK